MRVFKIIFKYKIELILATLIILAYFVTRLVGLLNFPIFTDEAIYVRWTQIALNDANWRFISLTDGKQPSLVWAGMIFLKLFQEPLLSLRLVSVVSGFITMLGLFVLTFELFKSKKAAFLSSLIYLVLPFAVVYDRLALYDSLLSAFVVWALYVSVLLAKKVRLDLAFILGFLIGGALLTKSSGIFSAYLLPFTLLLFNFKDKRWMKNLIKWGFFVLLAFLLAQGIFNVIKLSPFANIIAQKNSIFVFTISEWIKDPFIFFWGNFEGLTGWLFTYLNLLIVPIIISLLALKKFPKEKLMLIAFFILPFIALSLFGKVIFPRFIFFMVMSLIPLISIGLIHIIDWSNAFFKKREINSKNVITGLIILFFLLYPIKVSLDFITDPTNARIASADYEQYISGWPSGGGVKESIEFFENEAKKDEIFIATQGTFGLLPYALEIYLDKNPNITIKGYWPIDEFPEELLEKSETTPVYFVFYQPCPDCDYPGDVPNSWPLKLIDKYEKSNNTYYSVYLVEN